MAYDRQALLTQAHLALNEARKVWQEELIPLRSMLHTLRAADMKRINLTRNKKSSRRCYHRNLRISSSLNAPVTDKEVESTVTAVVIHTMEPTNDIIETHADGIML